VSPVLPDLEGKKTFFVQPSSVIRTEMIAELIKLEYEVYLVNDANDAKKLFSRYPNCLAFLNIDDGLSELQWLRLVREVQQDPNLSNVKIGVLTYNQDKRLAEEYLINLRVACGFVKLSLKMKDSLDIITRVLDVNEAKGRRKYLRVHCDQTSGLSFKDGRDVIEGRILDLSSVGMTCVLTPDKRWPKGSSLAAIRLKLEGGYCTVSGVVMGSRPMESSRETMYLVLFDTKTDSTNVEKIRAYMQKRLQSSLETALREAPAGRPEFQDSRVAVTV
jgi:hypothetical protein